MHFYQLLVASVALGDPAAWLPGAPVMLAEKTASGSAEVFPTAGVSGRFGTWTVTYWAGKAGIATRGGLRVQLPDSWHSSARNSANRLQVSDPADAHHVTAHCSRASVRLLTVVESETKALLVKHAKASLDGRLERYVFVVRVIVVEGSLRRGDTISVVYGDRRGGGPGYRAAAISTSPEPVLVAVDEDGSSRFRLLRRSPWIVSLPGGGAELLVHVPSNATVGQPIRVTVSLLDSQTNLVAHAAKIDITGAGGTAAVPRRVTILPARGHVTFSATPHSVGVLRLRATWEAGGLSSLSGPSLVDETPAAAKIYWGDLHSHTRFSWDGVGDGAFRYARHASALDFYAMTDHSIAPVADGTVTRGLCQSTWPEYTALTDRHHEPHRFVTLHAYECSFRRPFGHHNVYFRNRPGPLLAPTTSSLPELWRQLRAGDALTIPHHTGKFPAGIELYIHDAELRRNFEIYSGHGLSETHNPDHPLAFEQSLFTADSRSLPEPTFAQDAWRAGLCLSTIASSDDHRSRPGQPHYGLVAVRAPALTRDAIFQALFDRSTYATTGARIILDFRVNGARMGELVEVDGSPLIDIDVIGTDSITLVEILRYQPTGKEFRIIRSWEPGTSEFTGHHVDTTHGRGAMYYARLRQRQLIRGRTVMAWSSPIWTR